MNDGTRKVTHITEVAPEVDEHGRYVIRDIFRYIQRGRTAEGKIVGEMVATGYLPSFMQEIEINRLPFGREKFTAPSWYLELIQSGKIAA